MCIHSQAKTHHEMSLEDGIKHDLRAAIQKVDISSISANFIELEDWRMKEISWKTLKKLIKPHK